MVAEAIQAEAGEEAEGAVGGAPDATMRVGGGSDGRGDGLGEDPEATQVRVLK